MALYATVSVLVVALMFCVNMAIVEKNKILHKDSIFIISIASIVISISFPTVLNGFIEIGNSSNFNLTLLAGIITCMVLIVITSLIISYLEYNGKNVNIMSCWQKSIFLRSFEKIGLPIGLLVNENTGFVEVQASDSSVQGKNILQKPVDTEQNIDTMGIETFNSESLFLNENIAIQTDNKTDECCPEYTDNLIMDIWNRRSDSTENLESGSFIDDYEVYEDYFEEEVLNEFQDFENKYSSYNNEIAEKEEVDFITSICDEVNSESILQEELSVVSEDEYLDNSLDIVFNEIILDGQDIMSTNFDSNSCDINTIEESDNSDEIMELVAAHMDEYIAQTDSVSVETLQYDKAKTVDEIIDEAFDLKGKGDFEGAILNFFYALDNEPSNDIVFWIVLDICVLYKQLGQVELAKEVLESYVSHYGELMDKAVRYEIELNLQ